MTFAETIAALPARQRELFRMLQEFGGPARAVDVGGSNGSHHTKTLRVLVAKGLVDATRTEVFRSWRYRARESLAQTTQDSTPGSL